MKTIAELIAGPRRKWWAMALVFSLNTLTVFAQAPTITTQPQSQTVVTGVPVTFTVVATGTPAPTYQWKKSGTVIAGATGSTLFLPAVYASDASSYTVVASNSGGSVTSSVATLAVRPAPQLNLDKWTWQNPMPQGNDLQGVAWSGTQFVAVGVAGTILTSPDGATWTSRSSDTTSILRNVAWGGTRFVAVGETGTILTSPDGVTWTSRSSGTTGWLFDAAWSGTQFVAVGEGGMIRTSPDGAAWTSRSSGTTRDLYGVVWSGTQFVAVGNGGAIFTSPDGVAWTSRSSGTTKWLPDVAWSGTQFIALGYPAATGDSGTILTSPDGATWTSRSSGTELLTGVAWSGTRFVAVGQNTSGDRVYSTSPDGIGWSNSTSINAIPLRAVAWSGTQFVAVGYRGAITTSPNGTAWTSRSSDTKSAFYDVTWSGTQFVAVGYLGWVCTSPDGATWTGRASATTDSLGGVAWNGTQFMAVSAWGTTTTSTDGVKWNKHDYGTANKFVEIVWGGSQFVAVLDGTGTILTSPDGAAWTSRSSGATRTLRNLAWSGSQFVAVGDGGTILTSPDGAAWTSRSSGTTSVLNSVAWSGSQFVAVGSLGTILTSPDGAAWTSRSSGTTNTLTDVAASGTQLVAVGNPGTILASFDGATWSRYISGTPNTLYGVVWSGTQFVAIGDTGTILTASNLVAPPTITAQPQSQMATAGANASFTVSATGGSLTYQWMRNGSAIAGATSAAYQLTNAQPADAGLYTAVVSGVATSMPAMFGIATSSKVIGYGQELTPVNITHPNGNTFDQVLLTGYAESITADSSQVTRTSYIDLDNDIVQVEFSGPGTLSLVLDSASGPALPQNYNQNVQYMKGHAGIVITGATENTNVSVFSVGRATAVNGALFKDAVNYDGIADIAFIAIASSNGRFGGVRTANVNYFASHGVTGIYAPGVTFEGPVFIGDITAFDAAAPKIVLGGVSDARITGGDLFQDNVQAVQVSGITQLRFTAGSDSHGNLLPATANRAVLQQNGQDVTAQIVVNP